MGRHAIFLRGINLGKARRVSMADLRDLLTDAGYENVATLLQSGNVVLDAGFSGATLRKAVERALADRLGMVVDVAVRSRAQLLDIVAANPLGDLASDGSKYFVWFFAERPTAAVTKELDQVDAGDDRYLLDGTELYLWCPSGTMKSPLYATLGKMKGGPVATARNWNTVRKLVPLLG